MIWALRGKDLYTRLVWSDIADHWRDLAAFRRELERDKATANAFFLGGAFREVPLCNRNKGLAIRPDKVQATLITGT
jgi:hypothetical protein